MKLNKLFLVDKRVVKCYMNEFQIHVNDEEMGRQVVESYDNIELADLFYNGLNDESVLGMLDRTEMKLSAMNKQFVFNLN